MKKLMECKQNYQRVRTANFPSKMKKQMLEGIKYELERLAQLVDNQSFDGVSSSLVKFQQTTTNCTNISHLSLNSNDISSNSNILSSFTGEANSAQYLQQKIVQNQRVKIMLNEQIENLQDDYFELHKIIQTKKEYSQDLERKIAKKSYQISKNAGTNCEVRTTEDEKKSLSYRLMNFFLF